MQVRSRDRAVHNKCNNMSNMVMCLQTIVGEFEHERLHQDPKDGELFQ